LQIRHEHPLNWLKNGKKDFNNIKENLVLPFFVRVRAKIENIKIFLAQRHYVHAGYKLVALQQLGLQPT
jgi:hypothetical protein